MNRDSDDESSEYDRLTSIISKLFKSNWSLKLENNAQIDLRIGADGQDDCAVFSMTGAFDLVVGSDYVRGPKFTMYELGHLTNYELGWYLATANLSDIAAMGAKPIGMLSVVRYPRDMTDAQFTSVLEGVRDACAENGTLNVGGDIGSAERLILSGAALGITEPGTILLRSNARPGDMVCLTGPTGLAGTALQYFSSKERLPQLREDTREVLLKSWRRPKARIAEGRFLSQSGAVTACADTSDGLKGALEAIAQASGVGFVLEEASLPIVPEVTEACALLGVDPLAAVFGDSVDFQLVMTLDPAQAQELLATARKRGHSFSSIGRVSSEPALKLRRPDGTVVPIPGTPWRHTDAATWVT